MPAPGESRSALGTRTPAGATAESVRQHNLGTLTSLLHQEGPATRSELGVATGLNRSTVGVLAAELVGLGLAVERPGSSTGVGRPSIVVAPRSDRIVVLAVDLRVNRIVVALIGFGGVVLARRETGLTRPGGQSRPRPPRTADRIAALCQAVLDEAPPGARCIGVGVGVPGLVRHHDDVVGDAPNLGWHDVPLGELLRDRLPIDVPIGVRNDADLGARAEHWRGAAKGAGHAIYLAGGIGIGAGVIIADRMLEGAGGYGGEIGHIQVNPSGRTCLCGAIGCWETEIGKEAFLAAAGRAGEPLRSADIVELARSGDAGARRAVRTVSRWLAVGVADIVNVFSPEVVVFGGSLRAVFPAARADIERAVDASLVGRRQSVRLVLPALAGDSTLIGAAEAAFEPLLLDTAGTLESVAYAVR